MTLIRRKNVVLRKLSSLFLFFISLLLSIICMTQRRGHRCRALSPSSPAFFLSRRGFSFPTARPSESNVSNSHSNSEPNLLLLTPTPTPTPTLTLLSTVNLTLQMLYFEVGKYRGFRCIWRHSSPTKFPMQLKPIKKYKAAYTRVS